MRKIPRIPTLVALGILTASIAVGVFFVQQRTVFRLAASPEETPHDVRITNITDTSFAVSWTTAKSTTGTVTYGTSSSLGQTSQSLLYSDSSTTHYAVVRNLSPNTQYFFKIISGKGEFGQDGGTNPWIQKTAPSLPTRISDIISGIVKNSSGTPVANVLVYATIPNGSAVSGFTDTSGKFSIILSVMRTSDLSSYVSYDLSTIISLFAQSSEETGTNCCSSAQVLVSNAHPIPDIILGKTHDFSKALPQGESTSPRSNLDLSQSASPTPPGTSGFALNNQGSSLTPSSLTIDNPREGEKITTDKPEFRGTASPGATLTIVLESQPITATVVVPSDGKWKWSPSQAISQGAHTLTLTAKDTKGTTQRLARAFTVASVGGGTPAFSSSSSAGLTTPSPSPSPRPSSTPRSSTSPSASPRPTASSSAGTSLPSTAGGVPIAGDLTITFVLFILGIGFLFAGAVLFRKRDQIIG